ncbi:MAG: winged helix-turn-helix transcriptional regulator [Candidatus Lokiarchaeota archaeon]|nr:winged helix-turn-helix transcriptional regulator [Candidatus Lokiarchaeota archaeon]
MDIGSNNSKNSLENQIRLDSEKHAKILDSGLKVRILMMLLIFPELTLTELSAKMGKAKSTISKHIKELIKIGLIDVRQQHYRGSIKQKIYSARKKRGYRGRTYEDLKQVSPHEFIEHLHEEFLINLRLFTYIQETNQQILMYISDFYDNITQKDITEEFVEEKYRYNTCIPRIIFLTKEEYIDYRNRFLIFERDYIYEMEQTRMRTSGEEKPKEYLVVHELIPIREILEYVLDEKRK